MGRLNLRILMSRAKAFGKFLGVQGNRSSGLTAYTIRLIIYILLFLKGPKPWELWHIPKYG